MAFQPGDDLKIEKLLKEGAGSVRLADGRSVTFTTPDELWRTRDRIRRELAGKSKRVIVHKVAFGRD